MSHFFAVLSRMKHIRRWGLMRCTREENLYEHSYETAVLAHALALLRNQRGSGGRVSPERPPPWPCFTTLLKFSPATWPTPVKYDNPALRALTARQSGRPGTLLRLLPPACAPPTAPCWKREAPARRSCAAW